MNPLLLVDSYKIHHTKMYPDGMTKLYSNFTPRKSRMKGVDKVVTFGIQHFILEYLIKQFNDSFFLTIHRNEIKNEVLKNKIISEYKKHCNVDTAHIEALWDLGYLPIEIKSLDEGTLCPIGVPMLTITNTHPDFGWLVNYLETLISCSLWQGITSATIAYEYKKILEKYAIETTGSTEGVQWQAHDFSMRGMSSVESATISGMGHLTSFTGTDTIPSIYALESYYNAKGLIGASVPATEHSVMCMGTKENQLDTLLRHIKLYPTGILSEVMDTWDLTQVAKPDTDGLLVQAKKEILSRDGKLVIRPDSCPKGLTPADILFGHNKELSDREKQAYYPEFYKKGLIECLWDIFGGTVTEQGYKLLNSHIGGIYGDSITISEATEICERAKTKGFAVSISNFVLGIGSFTYQYNTRDTFGFAMKATYGEITHNEKSDYPLSEGESYVEPREIFKDPITDDGTKKSKKGLLQVDLFEKHHGKCDLMSCDMEGCAGYCKEISVKDQCTWEEEKTGLLTTVFKDGKLVKETTLDVIRIKLNGK